jgi:hypothetical protein
MNNGFRLVAILVLLGAGRTRAESTVMNRAASWHPLSTGALAVAQDEKELAYEVTASLPSQPVRRCHTRNGRPYRRT